MFPQEIVQRHLSEFGLMGVDSREVQIVDFAVIGTHVPPEFGIKRRPGGLASRRGGGGF